MTLLGCFALAGMGSTVKAQVQRSEIEEKYTWDLSALYASEKEWETEKDSIKKQVVELDKYRGTLTRSAQDLYAFLTFISGTRMKMERLSSYAARNSDTDVRIAENRAKLQELGQISNDFSAASAFVEPELVQLEWEDVEKFIQEEPKLEDYRQMLHNTIRTKQHTLSEAEEKIMAHAGLIAGNSASTFRTLSNAEMPFSTVTLSDGNDVKLNQAAYSKYRNSESRSDRKLVFDEFWRNFSAFNGTYGETLYGQVKSHMFHARSRKYESSLHSALDRNNIPVDVYHSLIEGVNKNLDSFHRYLSLRKRMLGVDTLRHYDMYAPVVKDVSLKYEYEQACELVLEALQPLGDDYVNVVQRAMKERWIDVYPNEGKRTGAYSDGIYGVHPYILLNYNGLYDDVGTLAHELGHTMHSYLSNATQPYPKADYSIFVAEVASTFNEALLFDKMRKDVKDDDVKLSLLMSYLDGFKGTLFRQTQFAEFELKIHETAEAGTPLTGQKLNEIYSAILKKYYGHEKGICMIDESMAAEWSYIPHFYYNFYVYQYATSFTASMALAEKVLSGEKGANESYLKFLSAGGSDYPVNVLKMAGVDMTTSEPFDKAMVTMNKIMDEIEAILNQKGK